MKDTQLGVFNYTLYFIYKQYLIWLMETILIPEKTQKTQPKNHHKKHYKKPGRKHANTFRPKKTYKRSEKGAQRSHAQRTANAKRRKNAEKRKLTTTVSQRKQHAAEIEIPLYCAIIDPSSLIKGNFRFNDGKNLYETAQIRTDDYYDATTVDGVLWTATTRSPWMNSLSFITTIDPSTYDVEFANASGVGSSTDEIVTYANPYSPETYEINIVKTVCDGGSIDFNNGPFYSPSLTKMPEKKWVWMNSYGDVSNDTITFNCTAEGEDPILKVSIMLNDYTPQEVVALPITDGTVTFPASGGDDFVSGWYSFAVTWEFDSEDTVASVTFLNSSITYAAGNPLTIRSVPQIEALDTSATDILTTGVKLMLSNTTATLNKEGDIVMAQFPKKTNILDFMYGNLTYSQITGQVGCFTGNAEKGAFGFFKPSSLEDFSWSGAYNFDASLQQNTNLTFFLDDIQGFIVSAVQCTPSNEQIIRISTGFAGEYQTNLKFIETHGSALQPTECADLISSIKKVVQFHENPAHKQGVLDGIKNAMSTGMGIVKTVEDIASIIGF